MISSQKLLILGSILCLSLVLAQAEFSKSIIDKAMGKKPVSYYKTTGSNHNVVGAAQAFYYLTLVASTNPGATSSDGKKVKDRVLSTFRNLVAGNNEPQCSNPLYGWSDGPVALALVLIKRTPALWNELNSKEQEKADWLMKALAIAGNWAFNDANNYRTGLGGQGNFHKGYNPNFIQGYMGVMVSFSLYFGADAGNKILTSFSYNQYISQFKSYNWNNIVSTWEKTGSNRMENGGSDGLGGNGRGVKLPFKWNGKALSDLNGIFYAESVTGSPNPMYSKKVVNSVGAAHILSGSSPVLGQMGMCSEFDSGDSKGLRSDALYAMEGWMNNLITRATMKHFGVWGGPGVDQIEKLMNVGTIDLMYKLSKGYQGVNVHGTRVVDDKPNGDADAKGYPFLKDIWLNFINK